MKYDIKPGTRSGNFAPGDVLNFLPGKYDYFEADGMSGTETYPIILQFNAGVIFGSGFDFQNVNWLILDGGANKNLVIKDAGGVPLSFKGKCSNIEIKGVQIDNAFSFIWFKTEVNEPAYANWKYWNKNADKTISPNYVMDGLKLSNFQFTHGRFDGGYIDSTGQNNDRPVTIDGVIYYPFPAPVANVQIQDGIIDGAARTGLQISGLKSGTNFIKNVQIKNCGTSLESFQGACFLLGGNSPAGIEVDGCTFDGSNLYAARFDGGGIIKFTNNTVQNATVVNGKANAQPMASVQFDSYENEPATFIITGNKIGKSNNGVSVVVYGNNKSISADSVFDNNTLEGTFVNQTGVEFKKQDNNGNGNGNGTPPPPDNNIVYYKNVDVAKSTFAFYNSADEEVIRFDSVERVILNVTTKKYFVKVTGNDKQILVGTEK